MKVTTEKIKIWTIKIQRNMKKIPWSEGLDSTFPFGNDFTYKKKKSFTESTHTFQFIKK